VDLIGGVCASTIVSTLGSVEGLHERVFQLRVSDSGPSCHDYTPLSPDSAICRISSRRPTTFLLLETDFRVIALTP
jgi:hypothetical protein